MNEFENKKITRSRLNAVHLIRQFFATHSFIGRKYLRWIAEKVIVKILMPNAVKPLLVPTLYGYDIICDPIADKGLETHIFQRGYYEAGTLSVMNKCLRKSDLFFDIGSNIGLMALYASMAVGDSGRVHAFEPQESTVNILKNNIQLNNFNNISTYSIALGATSRSATIYASPESRGSSSLIQTPERTETGSNIPVKPLDDFVKENNISTIRMVKIDVEGWELEVLKGGKDDFWRRDDRYL